MKIAYINLHWPRTKSSSIGKKMERQINAWRNLGHEVCFFSHMHQSPPAEPLIEGERFFFFVESGLSGRIKTEASRIKAAISLIHAVNNFKPDIIYLRWAMYVYPIQQLAGIAPYILEINTNDVLEHRMLGPVLNAYNRLTRWITLGHSSGLVFTTDELSKLKAFTKFKKLSCVVPNSIELSSTPFHSAPNNTVPRLLFIGTPGLEWQGVDKLVQFAEDFPDIEVDIVGYDEIPGKRRPPSNLILHGYREDEEFEKILAQADAAIGTMGLHRKGMEEASPLKIRDCLARGIPCILPYTDSDLKHIKNEKILKIPNSPDNLVNYGEEIHNFVYRMRGKRVSRDFLGRYIDSKQKESERLAFFEKVKSNSDKN